MNQRTRKFLGTIAMILLLIVYSILVGAIYANFLGGQDWWVLILLFAAAGLFWFFPAAWTIRWMSRPDA
ncbi:MAG TPA: DUF2842 domain-containing protein [Alphaproteobacteria bacterium]|nr:DUF2842 domain-containing protein [Alphaproteobacteria bacterium]